MDPALTTEIIDAVVKIVTILAGVVAAYFAYKSGKHSKENSEALADTKVQMTRLEDRTRNIHAVVTADMPEAPQTLIMPDSKKK